MYGNDSRLTAEQERDIVENATRLFTIDVYYSPEIKKLGLPCLSGYDINKIACASVPGLQNLVENTVKITSNKFADDFIQLLLNPPEVKPQVIDVEPIESTEMPETKNAKPRSKAKPKKCELPKDDSAPEEAAK